MKDFLEICASAMRRPWFYFGAGCLAASALVNFFLPQESGSSHPPFLNMGLNFAILAVYFTVFLVHLRELRDEFVVAIPERNAWNMGCSLAWFHLKCAAVILVLMLPIGVVTLVLKTAKESGHLLSGGTSIALVILAVLFALLLLVVVFAWCFFYITGSAMVLARGHAHRAVRDSWKSFPPIWVETLLILILATVLSALSASGTFLGILFPGVRVFFTGIEIALAPAVYLSRIAGLIYLAKLLRARAPTLISQREEAGDQSSSSEA